MLRRCTKHVANTPMFYSRGTRKQNKHRTPVARVTMAAASGRPPAQQPPLQMQLPRGAWAASLEPGMRMTGVGADHSRSFREK